jgi:hypothetical protein
VNPEQQLSLIRLHYTAWLGMTPWPTFEEAAAAPTTTIGDRRVVECTVSFICRAGIDLEVLQALIDGDADRLDAACAAFNGTAAAFVDALPDGTYTRGMFQL